MYRVDDLGHGPAKDMSSQPSVLSSPHPTNIDARFFALLNDCPNVEGCRHSAFVERLLTHNDFDRAKAYEVTFSDDAVVLLIVNAEVWREPAELRRLRQLVRDVADRVVVLPKAILTPSPAHGWLAESSPRSTLADRLRLVLHLVEHGTSTLFDCACVVTSSTPVAEVLQVAAEGFVDLNLDAAVGPTSPVSLPAQFL